jgi:hypothetical protein
MFQSSINKQKEERIMGIFGKSKKEVDKKEEVSETVEAVEATVEAVEATVEAPVKKESKAKTDWFQTEGKKLVGRGVGIKTFINRAAIAYGVKDDYVTIANKIGVKSLIDMLNKGQFEEIAAKVAKM